MTLHPIAPLRNTNPGIVPPWLSAPEKRADRNPGIVPPWLTKPADPGDRNPGIVPPWLVDVPRILPINMPHEASATSFARESANVSPPPSLAEALRSAR